jgi:hypothetical protein
MSRKSTKKRFEPKKEAPIDDPVVAEASVAPEPEAVPEPEVLVTLDTAAIDLGVSLRCARLWFNHGHLCGPENQGFVRVSTRSIATCRKKFLGGKG